MEKSVQKEEDVVVCILGMHRSGTSMITRLLNLCGLYLGENNDLLGAAKGNEFGHWEHSQILEINEEILKRFGGSWDNPPIFPKYWEKSEDMSDLRSRAKILFASMRERKFLWGFKEPRTCLTLPFWKQIIPNMVFVIPVRSSLEVAESLHKRDEKDISEGVFLWSYYWESIIRNTVGEKVIFTQYAEYFLDWKSELKRVLDFIGDKRLECKDENVVESFISPGARHNNILSEGEYIHIYQHAKDGVFLRQQEIIADLNEKNILCTEELRERDQLLTQKEAELSEQAKCLIQKEAELQAQKDVVMQKSAYIDLVHSSKFWKLRSFWEGIKWATKNPAEYLKKLRRGNQEISKL